MRDYHLHTSLCKHAMGTMEEYVEAAIKAGMSEICFTDHIPLPENEDIEHRMSMDQMEWYLKEIQTLKAKYREITILTGIEADYIEGYEEFLEEFLASYPFDLVIMSIHFIRKWSRGQWVFDFHYTRKDIQQKYHDYFDAMFKGIETGLFDVVAHLDIVKRPKLHVMRTNYDDVDDVLDAVKNNNMCIELNTSGLRKPINQTYPTFDIVQLAIEKGIPLILSSDAHKPEHVGNYFDEMYNKLFPIEGVQLARFNGRICTSSPLVQPIPIIDEL